MNQRSKKTLLAILLAAVAAVLVWLAWPTSDRENPARASSAPARAEPAAPRTDATALEPADEPTPVRDEAPASSSRDTTPTPPKPATKKADLEAREWITFHVENSKGFPVGGAEIELTGLRTVRERGSHYGWRGEPSLGKTDASGNLKLAYPVWVNLDDETGEISFAVTHPDYATYEDTGRKVEPQIKVVLAMGSVLVVSGWLDDPSHVITDVEPQFSWDVDIKPEDWLPRRDGRLTTTRVPAGVHSIYLRHKSEKYGLLLSDMTEFTLEAGETKELHLELRRPRQLTGRFDDAVPRPVVDGRVVLAVQMNGEGARGALLRTFDMPVDADGNFAIGGIMPGEAQIVALCKGWASKEQALTHDDLDSADSSGETEWVSQIVDVRLDENEYVVAMEPTAALEVELHTPDGSLAPGVRVDAWPNACWRVGACGMFLDSHEWSAVTDARGVARIEDIPAGQHSFGVTHAAYDLPLDPHGDPNARRSRTLKFTAGETTRVSYTLERKGGG